MKFIVHVSIPPEKFNKAVLDGTIGQKMAKILEETKPEAAYRALHTPRIRADIPSPEPATPAVGHSEGTRSPCRIAPPGSRLRTFSCCATPP